MNTNIMLKQILLAIVIFGMNCSIANAQEQRELKKEVEVRTNYQPKINKAKRLGRLPEIKDISSFTPDFNYYIQTKPLGVGFAPDKIPAAKIIGEPLLKLNSHSLTLAGGNYSSLLGDYRYNNRRSKTTDIGLHLRHYSTNGKIKLEDGDQVKPNYTEQMAEIYGTGYLSEGVISGNIFYKHKGFNYYGFPQNDDVPVSFINLFPYHERSLNNFGMSANYQSVLKTKDKPNFGLGLKYQHFADDLRLKENDILLSGNVKIKRDNAIWKLISQFDYFATNGLFDNESGSVDQSRNSLKWSVKPQYLLASETVNLKLGVDAVLVAGDDSESKLYPDVKLDFNLIDGVISLFAGVNGDYKLNRYKSIVEENNYLYSGLNVEPTNLKYHLFGGMKGSLSSTSSFVLSAQYSAIDNQYFFVQINTDPANGMYPFPTYSNKFGVVYDDINLLQLSAELNLAWSDKLNLSSKLTYNSYSLDTQQEAWHKPNFNLEANASYQFTKQIQLQSGVNIIGERSALSSGIVKKLDAVYLLNVGAKYQYNKQLAGFVKINNLFADKYYQWDGYPTQGLNFLIGINVNL